jgi:DNA-binding response OmpR family regulator
MSSCQGRILVVDDDHHVGELLSMHLEEIGFKVTRASDGIRGLELGLLDTFDLVILDVMLPGRNGVDICRELRTKKIRAPIMMLTSKGEEVDKVLGLEMGADDYVTKPFSIREICARVKALLRRSSPSTEAHDVKIEIRGLMIDPTSHEVSLNGKTLELTSTEFDLLHYMAKSAGRAFSREQLLTGVWGYTSSAYEHTVNTHINRLRSKIEPDPANPTFIQTVWGVGYKCAG